MKHDFSTIRAVLQDLRDMETKEDIEKAHLCNLPTASDGFAALERIEARVAKLEAALSGLLGIIEDPETRTIPQVMATIKVLKS